MGQRADAFVIKGMLKLSVDIMDNILFNFFFFLKVFLQFERKTFCYLNASKLVKVGENFKRIEEDSKATELNDYFGLSDTNLD